VVSDNDATACSASTLTVVTDAWYAELSIDDDDMAYGSSSIMWQLISDNVVTVG